MVHARNFNVVWKLLNEGSPASAALCSSLKSVYHSVFAETARSRLFFFLLLGHGFCLQCTLLDLLLIKKQTNKKTYRFALSDPLPLLYVHAVSHWVGKEKNMEIIMLSIVLVFRSLCCLQDSNYLNTRALQKTARFAPCFQPPEKMLSLMCYLKFCLEVVKNKLEGCN